VAEEFTTVLAVAFASTFKLFSPIYPDMASITANMLSLASPP
jgi:hypothetical protein